MQPSSSGHRTIGRRRNSDLSAIGDNLVRSIRNSSGAHNHIYNLQMLDATYDKLPQSKDLDLSSYVPVHKISSSVKKES